MTKSILNITASVFILGLGLGLSTEAFSRVKSGARLQNNSSCKLVLQDEIGLKCKADAQWH
jgi:hypothetical protein